MIASNEWESSILWDGTLESSAVSAACPCILDTPASFGIVAPRRCIYCASKHCIDCAVSPITGIDLFETAGFHGEMLAASRRYNARADACQSMLLRGSGARTKI